ncbi:MAG: nucleotidyltransferase family protein [Clostridia bacterium]|nr:nucleotidyltransferase family protein [Clostridia bacterium]
MYATTEIMMHLLRCSALGTPVDADILSSVNGQVINDMYNTAYHHDLVHLLGDILEKNGLLGDDIVSRKYREQVYTAIYRYEKLKYEIQAICQLFEENMIPFIPLKGVVLREFYKEPWLRTSCDADILVRESDLEKAGLLLESRAFSKEHIGAHDIKYTCGDGVIIELHFTLTDDYESEKTNGLLSDVWNYAKPREGYKYYYNLSDDFFRFYHIAHAAKHFVTGGCGIKPVLDLYVLKQAGKGIDNATQKLLDDSNLLRFEYALDNLSKVWFEGKEHDAVTSVMEDFILKGGVYGSENNYFLLRKRRAGGKAGYIFSRIFVSFNELKYEYPILSKKPFLLPFFELYRWIVFIAKGDKKTSKRRYDNIKNVSEENLKNIDDLLNKLGL